MQWNLEWLRTFKAIYEKGTLSAAANEIFISQPGVSLHLSSLESYVGYKLFDRSSRKMVPTEKGKNFYNFILEPLLKLENAEQHFHRRCQPERSTISLGMCFETFQYTLEEHVAKLPFNMIIKFGPHLQMQTDLDNGLLDMVVTTKKGNQQNLIYEQFSKERMVLIAGSNTDTSSLRAMLENSTDFTDVKNYLKKQLWYSTAGDMEHLQKFWKTNFDEHPDFNPNYIVPNISSIIRCLGHNEGYSVVPDFLCQVALEEGKVQLVWQGRNYCENALYFGTRKNTMYHDELSKIKKLFSDKQHYDGSVSCKN